MWIGQSASPGTSETFSLPANLSDAVDWVLVAFVVLLVTVLGTGALFRRRRLAQATRSGVTGSDSDAPAGRRMQDRVAELVERQRDVDESDAAVDRAPSRRLRGSATHDPAVAAFLAMNARANRELPASLGEFVKSGSRSQPGEDVARDS